MKIKDQAMRELQELRPRDLLKVYDLIISLKERPDEGKKGPRLSASYLRVREALKQCQGSLSEDILWGREDRV